MDERGSKFDFRFTETTFIAKEVKRGRDFKCPRRWSSKYSPITSDLMAPLRNKGPNQICFSDNTHQAASIHDRDGIYLLFSHDGGDLINGCLFLD